MTTDTDLFLSINQALAGPVATWFFTKVTHLGDGLVLAALVLAPLFGFDRARFKRHAVPMVLAVALSGGVVNLMKIAVDRPRPAHYFAQSDQTVHTPLGTPSDRAFPSGHTQTAFGTATYLTCLYPKAGPLFMLLAAMVGLSRIAIGVHYPLDVLAGAFFRVAFSLAVFYWKNKRVRIERRQ